MDEDLQAQDVQIDQNVNIIPLIQAHLAKVQSVTHPGNAALPLAHIYNLLDSLGELDIDFQRRWHRILQGKFTLWAAESKWRRRLRWPEIWAATDALLRLLDRRGMLFHAIVDDPSEARHEDFLSALRYERSED